MRFNVSTFICSYSVDPRGHAVIKSHAVCKIMKYMQGNGENSSTKGIFSA